MPSAWAPGGAPPPQALPTFRHSTAAAPKGNTIPTLSGKTRDGKPITIQADGTAKVIMFVAHWCPHCQREVPLVAKHLESTPMPEGVKWLTWSTNVDDTR